MATFTKEEVFKKTLDYFNGDEIAANVTMEKYLLTTANGEYEESSPDDMHKRIAKELARIEKKYPNPLDENTIYESLKDFKYIIPQGSPLSSIGNNNFVQSTSNCFVIDSPADSYGGICKTDQEIVQICKRRGGVGVDISSIRPKNFNVKNCARTTDGIEVFMDRFSNSTKEVAQKGRRGALLMSISVHHPQILDFIKIKQKEDRLNGANISVKITDEFMNAVISDSEYELRFPIEKPIYTKKVKAKKVWESLIDCSWSMGEPGALFWDTILRNTPSEAYAEDGFKTLSTNPCITGDSIIAVADGRGGVPIKKLAECGNDVPVYSLNKNGEIEIKMGREPRLTQKMATVLEITLDDDTKIKVTPDHKMLLRDGTEVLAKNLKIGDSLPRINKFIEKIGKNKKGYIRIQSSNDVITKQRKFEHRLIAQFNNKQEWESLYNVNKQNGWVNGGIIIHHKDFNQLNNSPDNLEIMTFEEHNSLHNKFKTGYGEKNPMFGKKQTEETKKLISEKAKKRFENKEYKQNFLLSLSKRDNKAFSENLKNNYNNLYIIKMMKKISNSQYETILRDNRFFVIKKCECCNNQFEVSWQRRNKKACSKLCENKCRNKNIARRSENSIQKDKNTLSKQIDIFNNLKLSLNRMPFLKEWVCECKKNNIPYRFQKLTKNEFKLHSFKHLKQISKSINHKVKEIKILQEREDVYNITVDDNNTYAILTNYDDINNIKTCSGIFTHNCGEIVLSKQNSCILTLLNLKSFVNNPFTINAKFDFDLFSKYVQYAQRYLDDTVDLEIEKIDKIIEKIKSDPEDEQTKSTELNLWIGIKEYAIKGRRTGLGITALGDCIAELGIGYGTDEAIDLTGKIYKTLCLNSYTQSITLAEERGCFKVWSYEKEKDHNFIKKILDCLDEETLNKYYKYGRRNICNLTTSPAGTISILPNVTSGLEPLFEESYKRRRKIRENEITNMPSVTKDPSGIYWTEYEITHKGVTEWKKIKDSDENAIQENPYTNYIAHKIDFNQKIKLQAEAQKWVDHSISNTINLPEDVSKETVSNLFLDAWKLNCKGITVYRDKCRAGILIKKDDTSRNEVFKDTTAVKRPKTLPCDIVHITVDNEPWIIIVGLFDGKPYELFGGSATKIKIPKKYKTGNLVKTKKGQDNIYSLTTGTGDEELTVTDIVTSFDNTNYSSMTRLISLSLRHGANIQYVVEQLQKDKNYDMFSFAKTLSRVLKKYIKNGAVATSEKICPNCGATPLKYTEGCISCSSCGWSKCG